MTDHLYRAVAKMDTNLGTGIAVPTLRRADKTLATLWNIGGRGGIRTHGGVAPTAVFKTAALNHSATLPAADALQALQADAALAQAHAAMLPPHSPRPRGQIDPDHALARAKIVEAETVAEAQAWLTPKERFALLHDRAGLDQLTRLAPA